MCVRAQLNGEARLFPILGDPMIYVIYAQSPERLARSFAARGHNGICIPMQVPEGMLESTLQAFSRMPNIDGILSTRAGFAPACPPTGCAMACNASPLGRTAGDPLPVAATLLAPTMFVGDVIAGHGETAFLAAARAAGCTTANGDQIVEAAQEMMRDFFLGA